MWGTMFFMKFYFVCGIGAGAHAASCSACCRWRRRRTSTCSSTIGASGAIFGVLLAYALYFPNRPILMFFIFPVPAKYFVMILGGIRCCWPRGGGGGVAHTAHLGGIAAGYLYLKGLRINLFSEIQYRYLKWRINRMRRKFDVYSGGRGDDIDRRVHLSIASVTRRLHRWDEIALEKITEMISQKIVAGDREMLAQIYLKRGALVPMHAHDSEQMTYMLQGALRFLVDGEEIIVREGEVLHIPSGTPHQAEALEDTFELDVFSPDPRRLAGCSRGAVT